MTLLNRLLSNDLPRSRWLALLLVAVVLGLAFTPFLFPGTKALNVAAKIVVFVVLVASYDLLLGYSGIVSFAHTMFFGIGAYGVAIASTRLGAGWGAVAIGVAAALAVSLVLSFLVGLFSLRVKAIFFAMITLAVASAFLTFASQLSELTGGDDGLSFKVPEALQPGYVLRRGAFPRRLDRRPARHLLPAVRGRAAARAGAAAHRQLAVRPGAAGDPRERLPRRGDRLPHRRLPHARRASSRRCSRRWPARCSRSGCATTGRTRRCRSRSCSTSCSSSSSAAWARCTARWSAARCSSSRRTTCRTWLRLGADALQGVPWAAALVSPDRWLLWLGVLFVLSVYHFPNGIVGRLRAAAGRSRSGADA